MAETSPTRRFLARLSHRAGRAERSVGRVLRRVRGHHLGRRTGVALGLIMVTLAGTSVGLLLAGRTQGDVGPFSAQFSVTPSLHGGTDVQIPPLGSLVLASHGGPAHLTIRLENLDQRRTLALAKDPNGLSAASEDAVSDVERGVTKLVLQAAGAAILGAMAFGFLVYRNMRRVAICGGLAMAVMVGSGVIAVATFRPGSVEEPKYHGLLTNAPAVVGDARKISSRFTEYRAELQRLVNNVSRLYSTFSTLPVYEPDPGTIRVLHISDLHLNPSAWSVIETVVQQFDINLVIDTGDLDDWGTQVESSFTEPIASLNVPYVFIRGNHDSELTAAAVAKRRNAIVLENQVATVDGLTIAGIGDPRFTPDKSTSETDAGELALLSNTGDQLAGTIRNFGQPVDIALVHDPASATPLAGTVPLVLAGHLHHREVYPLGTTADGKPGRTLMMVEGSTGGAGLRGLEKEQPTPLEMSVLYFDQEHALQAYDEITLGGTGETEVTLERHLISDDRNDEASPGPGEPSQSPG